MTIHRQDHNQFQECEVACGNSFSISLTTTYGTIHTSSTHLPSNNGDNQRTKTTAVAAYQEPDTRPIADYLAAVREASSHGVLVVPLKVHAARIGLHILCR